MGTNRGNRKIDKIKKAVQVKGNKTAERKPSIQGINTRNSTINKITDLKKKREIKDNHKKKSELNGR